MNGSGQHPDEGLSYGFKVSMSGSGHGSRNESGSILFNSCDGLQSEIEVQFLPDGASTERVFPVRGRKMGGIISFSRGVSSTGGANDFFEWYQAVCDSSQALKKKILNIMLVDTKESGKVLARWEVKGAWPCRWNGPFLDSNGNGITVVHLSFAYESLQKV